MRQNSISVRTSAGSGSLRRVKGKRGESWVLKARVAGVQFEKALGRVWTEHNRPPAGYLTRRGAEAAAREEMQRREDHAGIPAEVREATFSEICDRWLNHRERIKECKPSTLVDYRQDVEKVYVPFFGADTLARSITRRDIERFRDARECAKSTTNKHLRQLHGIFACSEIPDNPTDGVERFGTSATGEAEGDYQAFEPSEVFSLARAAESPQDAAIFVTAAFSGLRMGELRALRWADVNFAKATITVRRSHTAKGGMSTPKSRKVRTVPMTDEVAAALDNLSRREFFTSSDDLVFCGVAGHLLDESKLRKRYQAALKRAGLRALRFHDLRHTFGSLAIRVHDIRRVQMMMGHADVQTTMRYLHAKPQHDDAAKLSKLIQAESNPLPNVLPLDRSTSPDGAPSASREAA